MLKVPKSPELKLARGYSDPKSTVWLDGRESLRGKDWERRKRELWERERGKCQNVLSYAGEDIYRCQCEGHDPHHIKKRWPKRDDRLDNLALLCRDCHRRFDPRKVKWSKPCPKS